MGTFTKATKQKAKLRCALFGPSGAGKTYTALRIATGMGGKIAVIDTEHGSASKYADRFNFDVAEMGEAKDIDALCGLLEAAKGYGVVVIDSLTHSWQELLEEIDKLAKTKYRGNTWSAWSDGTPKQKRLVRAILDCPAHVIATIRSKTAWEQEKTDNGKAKPVRVGLAPEQGKGIEYEFDMLLEMSSNHIASVIKDRTGKFQDDIIEKPGEDFGRALVAWLNDGADAKEPPTVKPATRAKARVTLTPERRKAGEAYIDEFFADNISEMDAMYAKLGIGKDVAIPDLTDAQISALGKLIVERKKANGNG